MDVHDRELIGALHGQRKGATCDAKFDADFGTRSMLRVNYNDRSILPLINILPGLPFRQVQRVVLCAIGRFCLVSDPSDILLPGYTDLQDCSFVSDREY